MKKSFLKQVSLVIFLFAATLLFSRASFAYLALNETAELLPEGYFKLGLAPELKLTNGQGFNISAYFDTYLTEDTNARITIGGGEVDFWTSASVKWVPFPDVDKQPAIGLRGALIYARDESVSFYNVQFSPILSKLADTTYGKMIPYVGLPITFISTKDNSSVATQFALGAEWFSKKDMHVGGEVDLNLNKAFTAVSVFVSFPFDQAVGFKKH
jgi:hypothetical protein